MAATAVAPMKTSAMKASSEARSSTRGEPSGYASMVKTTEG